MIVRCCKCLEELELDEAMSWEGQAMCEQCCPTGEINRIACVGCAHYIELSDAHDVDGRALCSDCYTDGETCAQCHGSGEGQADGTTCGGCHGSGQLPSPRDIEQRNDRDIEREERRAGE